MNKQAEALKLALDFLMTRRMGAESVIDALQEALAQPEQELTEKEKISRGMTTEFVAMRALAHQEPAEVKCVVINNHHPDGITFEQWVKPAQQCVACEGKPSQENNPCAVCGKTAQRTWVGLTDEEIIEWVESGEYNVITNDWASHIEFARAIEAKLKEKNT